MTGDVRQQPLTAADVSFRTPPAKGTGGATRLSTATRTTTIPRFIGALVNSPKDSWVKLMTNADAGRKRLGGPW